LSFQFKVNRSTAKNVRRLARKQMDLALEALESPNREEAVHEVRRRLKKLRALLGLVRPGLDGKTYRQEKDCLRDAGRLLREVRDAQALIGALDKLTARFAEEVPLQPFMDVHEGLQAHQQIVFGQTLEEENALEKVAEALHAARRRLKHWRPGRRGWSVLGAGLKQCFKRAAQAFTTASAEPTVENLHECRKQAKRLWNQLRLLRPINPEKVQELADQAKALTDNLGDDHDLALLHQILAEDGAAFGNRTGVRKVASLIVQRRTELQRAALEVGGPLFQEKPRKWVKRLGSYWVAWRATATASS
jgi:CHAD domain-containing protein